MEIEGKHVVVTGAASGIGAALARRFAAEGAARVVVADLNLAGAEAVAREIDGLAVELDAGREESVLALIGRAQEHAPIDIFFSNAGVPGGLGGPESPDEAWDLAWRVNTMAHVWAARALVPQMVARGEGYLLSTASAAGLLAEIGSATYTVSKHAAVAFAEWLSIAYGDHGVRVSCLCPQGVNTPMAQLALAGSAGGVALAGEGLIEPEDVADVVVAAIADERFLILPHEQVAGYMALKASQPDRWLAGMRKILRKALAGANGSPPADA